jgi:hypothetical protein
MCLDSVYGRVLPDKGYGWKVFERKHNHKLVTQIMCSELPIGKWVKDTNSFPIRYGFFNGTYFHDTYPCGFHFYAESEYSSATKYRRKVKYRNPVVMGKQHGLDVIVAKEIYIIPTFRERINKLLSGEYI